MLLSFGKLQSIDETISRNLVPKKSCLKENRQATPSPSKTKMALKGLKLYTHPKL
jgi:hypothetical protein